MPSYMLLFRAPKHVVSAPRSATQARESGERWRAWEETLTTGGHAPTGAQLASEGKHIVGAAKKVEDGATGDDVVGGYFLVTAATLDEATELAKGCPVLANGGSVEVRPVMGS